MPELKTIDEALVHELSDVVRKAAKLAPSIVIEDDSRMVDDLGIDSLDLVGVLLQVQDHFGVEIDDDDVAQLKTIHELAVYLAERR